MKHKTKLQITRENMLNSLQLSVHIMLLWFQFLRQGIVAVSLLISGIGLRYSTARNYGTICRDFASVKSWF